MARPVRVLTVNTGSSSLKLGLLDGDDLVDERHEERWDGEPAPIADFLDRHGAEVVGHRVVHGGDRIIEATVVDDSVQAYLESLTELAPLHQPRAIEGIRVARHLAPEVPSVVCVDTAFHARLPPAAATYPLPREWNERYSLRRYGFHGLSHAYAVRRGAELVGMPAGRGKVLSCHLGAGASMAAVLDGRCVDTTMGFTPEEGLVMNTRSGSVDPGLLGWLINTRGLAPQEVFEVLAKRSGIAGLAGGSGDLRDVLDARENGDHDAATAFDVYRHSLVRHAGAMLAVLGGVDLLVFTGGVGEHQPTVRAAVGRALVFAGAAIDPARNIHAGEGEISAAGAAARSVVVRAREDLEVAREARVAVALRS
ncbi:acetate/propionate family kinase [Saccharopolyspora rhizosphaerae]|uniref:Acetate kinase n=1 Tax=Saccharopolyspora rhizosphaerae TaxID=2492662 RepID=A0A3R8NWX4_9PSEU|nr:acetate/propionate family kinase [Saccharopolyspora rhizosphaerae]RRO14766.1 acetate/propionate family kinase [Saccharopolyspora rhizosphaerae]